MDAGKIPLYQGKGRHRDYTDRQKPHVWKYTRAPLTRVEIHRETAALLEKNLCTKEGCSLCIERYEDSVL